MNHACATCSGIFIPAWHSPTTRDGEETTSATAQIWSRSKSSAQHTPRCAGAPVQHERLGHHQRERPAFWYVLCPRHRWQSGDKKGDDSELSRSKPYTTRPPVGNDGRFFIYIPKKSVILRPQLRTNKKEYRYESCNIIGRAFQEGTG